MKTIEIKELVKSVEQSLSAKDREIYKNAIEQLEVKLTNDIANFSDFNLDDYFVDTMELFYSEQYGYPEELYQGKGLSDRRNPLKNKGRDLRILLCKWLKKKKITKITSITLLNEAARELMLLSGLDPFTAMMFSTISHIFMALGVDKICEDV
jgi:hypothetical protein